MSVSQITNHRAPHSTIAITAWHCASIVWLAAIVTGFWALENYSNAPGEVGDAPTLLNELPGSESAQPQLMMFVHPKCPCSVASLNELARVLEQSPQGVIAKVVFVKPAGVEVDWEKSTLWRKAAGIPKVQVVSDVDGKLASQMGALTSGHVLLFDADGRLVFNGGITRSRGHEGESQGTVSLIAALNGREALKTTAPVFGCPLFSRQNCVESKNSRPYEANGNAR